MYRRISQRIPVAEHLSDHEYMKFLDGYAHFCGTKSKSERMRFCADQIESVDRVNELIIVTYKEGSQFTVETSDHD